MIQQYVAQLSPIFEPADSAGWFKKNNI